MIIDKSVEEYCEKYSDKEDELLHALFRETQLKTIYPRMIAGHLHGLFLSFMSEMLNPSRILEIGTFTGYSAICLAKGLKSNGELITIDNNPEVTWLAEEYFKKANLNDKIKLIIGNALEILPTLQPTFDLIYLDADKENYPLYYVQSKRLLDNNGILIVDNVLWDLKPLEENKLHTDKETKGIIEFNNLVKNDEEVKKLMLPFRDGIYIIRKNKT